MHGTTNIK